MILTASRAGLVIDSRVVRSASLESLLTAWVSAQESRAMQAGLTLMQIPFDLPDPRR